MANQALVEVLQAAERIDEFIVGVDRKRIDREVAPAEVLFDGDIGRRIEFEAVVAGCGLALCAGKRVFLAGLRVQEYREILADLFVAGVNKFIRRRAHNAPVPFFHRKPEPFVTNGATDEVHLHRAILASGTRQIVIAGRDGYKAWLLLAAASVNSGCYYVQAARGQYDVLQRREPIAEVIAAADTPENLARRLELVSEARQFAVDELLLPDNDSYKSYADIERDYVVWNVFAAPEFSLQPKTWCFPVAGCVAYRGYFNEDDAHRQAERLRAQGYDVAVGGVPAYSTLGRFDDPVLNTMMHWDEMELVATIFHELAHQRLYIKNDTAFNESFATAVADIGLERWLSLRGEEHQFEAHLDRRELGAELVEIIGAARLHLQALYDSELDEVTMRRRKEQRLQELSDELASRLRRSGHEAPGWLGGQLNNARIASIGLYQMRVAEFRALYETCARDLGCFYERASSLRLSEPGPGP